MKTTFKALKFFTIFALFLLSFIACDKDFSIIESEVLGIENANFSTGSIDFPVTAYNKKLEALQINNLSSNLIGVFDDPDYGTTVASIVTQLSPNTASLNPDFGINPVIESVVINIPYFSSIETLTTSTDTPSEYALDSLYGPADSAFKLSIYRNNYFLRDFNHSGGINNSQNYFSQTESLIDPTHNYVSNGTQLIDFDQHIGELIYQDNDFKISSDAIELVDSTGAAPITVFGAPALRISLNKDVEEDEDEIAFWTQTILEQAGSPNLSDANSFEDYFRGLYFKVEKADGAEGHMALIDLASSDANITITYSKGDTGSRTQSTYGLTFSGNRLNTFINNFDDVTLEDGDKDNGDPTLYLKGMEGSMAIVDLFPTDEALQDFRDQFLDSEGNQTKLINEAHLIVTDTYGENSFHENDRIFAYDIKNNATLIDYNDAFDPTRNTQTPLFSKIFSLGQRDSIGSYKIRITQHLNNIVQNDSTNYKIGLTLSNNVNVTSSALILNSNDNVTAVPGSSLISPRGSVLNGSHNSVDDAVKLRLKVYFTEPN